MANELGGGTKMEAKKGSDASSQTCCTTSFRMLEKHPSEISSPPNTTSLVHPVYTQILKNVKVLYLGKFVNYILEVN